MYSNLAQFIIGLVTIVGMMFLMVHQPDKGEVSVGVIMLVLGYYFGNRDPQKDRDK